MKIYKEYQKAIKKIGNIEKAYFTTYNLDISFIEKYILPPLLNEEIADNKIKLEDLNQVLIDKKIDISFFYDYLTDYNKVTSVNVYKVNQRRGVFHPKVIYLKGDKATYLIVGSGNLSVNGWGQNIEAFKLIKVDNENLHNQVLNFFDDIFKLAKVEKSKYRKKKRKVTYNNKIDFLYSFEEEENKVSIFLNSLNLKENIDIYSPYFSKDLDSLFKSKEFSKLKSINIIPDLIENQKIRLSNYPNDKRINFFRFEKQSVSDKNIDSINHSKVWISDTKCAIGSYNCTDKAIYGSNFEASIVFDYEKKGELSLDNLEKIRDLEFIGEDIVNEDDVEESVRYKEFYQLIADYKDNYKLILEGNNINNENKILLPLYKNKITINEFKKLSLEQRIRIFRGLSRNKLFEIYDINDNLVYKGFIIELGISSKNIIKSEVESLDDIFFALQDSKNPTNNKLLEKRKERFQNLLIEDDIIYQRKKIQNNISYFSMFSGFKNLDNEFKKIKDNQEKLNRFCYSSIISLEVMKSKIEEEKVKNKTLFLYLAIEELNKLIRKVNRAIDKEKKLQQLENIDIGLSEKDKSFIKKSMSKCSKKKLK